MWGLVSASKIDAITVEDDEKNVVGPITALMVLSIIGGFIAAVIGAGVFDTTNLTSSLGFGIAAIILSVGLLSKFAKGAITSAFLRIFASMILLGWIIGSMLT